VKWWPALLLVPLVVGPWTDEDNETRRPRSRWLPVIAGVGAWLVVQLPALILSIPRWWASVTFHLGREANSDSAFAALAALGNHLFPSSFWIRPFSVLATVGSLGLLGAGIVYVARRLHTRTVSPLRACLALVAIFLVTGKVFSPQFVLWLLPAAVLSGISWTPVLAVEVLNVSVWLLVAQSVAAQDVLLLRASQGTALVRSAAVLWLIVASLWPQERESKPTPAGAALQPARPAVR
jgi:uncharacterized membrane protein